MDAARQELLAILSEARALLALPDNDFAWSSWEDASAALQHLDGLIAHCSANQLPARTDLAQLLGPTGPLQEVSLTSGWGMEFVLLGKRFESVAERVYAN